MLIVPDGCEEDSLESFVSLESFSGESAGSSLASSAVAFAAGFSGASSCAKANVENGVQRQPGHT